MENHRGNNEGGRTRGGGKGEKKRERGQERAKRERECAFDVVVLSTHAFFMGTN